MRTSDQLPAEEQDILRYLPTAETPGFKLASPRVFQVLVALLDHARRFPSLPTPADSSDSADSTSKSLATPAPAGINGEGAANVSASASVTPKPAPPKSKQKSRKAKSDPKPRTNIVTIPSTPGLESHWTVTGLAHACGCNRNTAGATLHELVALGWIRKSIGRHVGGEYSGFWFRLLVPPSALTTTAHYLYQSKADEADIRVRERRARIKESITADGKNGPSAAANLDDTVKEVI